jgi:acetyl esterase
MLSVNLKTKLPSMEQTTIRDPELTTGPSHPLVYSTYLHCAASLLRNATAWSTSSSALFTKTGSIDIPGLGDGTVKYSFCIAAEHIQTIQPLPFILVIEGGGFVLGQPSDGAHNVYRLSQNVRIPAYSIYAYADGVVDPCPSPLDRLRKVPSLSLPTRTSATVLCFAMVLFSARLQRARRNY